MRNIKTVYNKIILFVKKLKNVRSSRIIFYTYFHTDNNNKSCFKRTSIKRNSER